MDRITLIHGDAREAVRGIPPNSIDAVITDPPYGDFQSHSVEGRSRYVHGGRWKPTEEVKSWREWDGTGIETDPEFWASLIPIVKPGAHLLAMNTPRLVHRMVHAIEQAWEIRGMIAWYGGFRMPASAHSISQSWETIVIARAPLEGTAKANAEKWGVGRVFAQEEKERSGRWPDDFWHIPRPNPKERADNNHPTVKPLELMRRLIRLYAPPDGVVLDPFLGSGTTAVAAKIEGRRCIGIETSSAYLEITRRRLARVS